MIYVPPSSLPESMGKYPKRDTWKQRSEEQHVAGAYKVIAIKGKGLGR